MPHPRVEEALKQAPVAFTVHRHADYPHPIQSPADFAAALNVDPRRITKTLLLRSSTDAGKFCLAVLSAPDKINLAYLAELTGTKKLKMASAAELLERLDYPPMSVTPLGSAGIAVYVDEGLVQHPTVLTGAGIVEVEIELSPLDLVRITGARIVQLKVPATDESLR
jgi:Cys-tRNA(Pro)/Cys-tRNA(Cys) deacylase